MVDEAAASFLFATCQIGAERALKSEMARDRPDFRFAFSRPGFLTFKHPAGNRLTDDFDLQAVFARTWGFTFGKVTGDNPAQLVWDLADHRPYDALHVWQRDTEMVGDHGYEPDITELAQLAGRQIVQAYPSRLGSAPKLNQITDLGDTVLDCVIVEPDQWWLGWHRAYSTNSSWPGGLFKFTPPADAVSRAYIKMEEALTWSSLPLRHGDHVAEIGCSPGGASQALLSHGLRVTGVDPADVDPRVLANLNFTHIRKRGADIRRREFRDVRWLVADMNVAPTYTLTTVEEIVTHPTVNVEGLLLTLKLIAWDLAAEIPNYLQRIGSWGYRHVAARQLSHNRQEICVMAKHNRS